MFETELQRQTFIAHGWTFPPCIHCGQPADRHGSPHPRDGDESDDCTGYDADTMWQRWDVEAALAVFRQWLVDQGYVAAPAPPADPEPGGRGYTPNLVIVDEVHEFPTDPEAP